MEKLKAIFIHHLDVSSQALSRDARMREDLHADSLDVVQLAMDVEETFNICITDDQLREMTTFGDWIDAVLEGTDQ